MTVVISIIVGALILGIGIYIYIYSTNSNKGIIIGDNNEFLNIDVQNNLLSNRGGDSSNKPGFYLSRESFLKVKTNTTKLETVIEMAIADGALRVEGRQKIKEAAISRGYDYMKVLEEVEKHVMFLEIPTQIKLLDLNEKNRIDFERLIVHKFCSVLFKIKEWTGEKYLQNEYLEYKPSPDIIIEFIGFGRNIDFAVKCKWKQRAIKNEVELSTPEELKELRDYGKDNKTPVFIVLGLEGKGGEPERLFIVPIRKISNPFMSLSQLKKYEKKVSANFYFDFSKKVLK